MKILTLICVLLLILLPAHAEPVDGPATKSANPKNGMLSIVLASRDLGDRGVLVVLFTKIRDTDRSGYQYLLVRPDNIEVSTVGGGVTGDDYAKISNILDVYMAPDEAVITVRYYVAADQYYGELHDLRGVGGRYELLDLPSIASLHGEPLKAHISGSKKDHDETIEMTDGKRVWQFLYETESGRWRKVAGPTTGPTTQSTTRAAATTPATAPAK